jgi:hypothetical protein
MPITCDECCSLTSDAEHNTIPRLTVLLVTIHTLLMYQTAGERYTDAAKTFFLATFYTALVPTGMFVAAFALSVTCIVDRYLLLRQWQTPPNLNSAIAGQLRAGMVLTILAHAIITSCFYRAWPFDSVAAVTTAAVATATVDAAGTSTTSTNGTLPAVTEWTVTGETVRWQFWLNTPQDWMPLAQQQYLRAYVALATALAVGLLVFHSVLTLRSAYATYWSGKRHSSSTDGLTVSERGRAQQIPFSAVERIEAFVPRLVGLHGAESYTAADLSGVRHAHHPYSKSDATTSNNLALDVPERYRRSHFGTITWIGACKAKKKAPHLRGSTSGTNNSNTNSSSSSAGSTPKSSATAATTRNGRSRTHSGSDSASTSSDDGGSADDTDTVMHAEVVLIRVAKALCAVVSKHGDGHIQQVFDDHADTDSNGSITQQQFQAALRSAGLGITVVSGDDMQALYQHCVAQFPATVYATKSTESSAKASGRISKHRATVDKSVTEAASADTLQYDAFTAFCLHIGATRKAAPVTVVTAGSQKHKSMFFSTHRVGEVAHTSALQQQQQQHVQVINRDSTANSSTSIQHGATVTPVRIRFSSNNDTEADSDTGFDDSDMMFNSSTDGHLQLGVLSPQQHRNYISSESFGLHSSYPLTPPRQSSKHSALSRSLQSPLPLLPKTMTRNRSAAVRPLSPQLQQRSAAYRVGSSSASNSSGVSSGTLRAAQRAWHCYACDFDNVGGSFCTVCRADKDTASNEL